MAKINRYDGNLAAFASQADTNRRTTFGTELTGDDTLDGNITPEYLTGWQIVGPNEFPTLEDFNAAFFTIGRLMAYVHQVGMPEWNGEQEYHSGSLTNRNGAIYVCLNDNHVSTTPPESDETNWFNATQTGQNIAVFDAAGVTNWPVPAVLQAGLRKAKVTVKGGGGSGGKGSSGAGGGGGCGAGWAIGILDLSGISSISITVGAGGASVTGVNQSGNSGDSSSFGAFMSATGGSFGASNGSVGEQGAGTGGDIRGGLGTGHGADRSGGSGGAGGGEGGGRGSAGGNGDPGEAPGAGGGGTASGTQSGAGADGIVIVEW